MAADAGDAECVLSGALSGSYMQVNNVCKLTRMPLFSSSVIYFCLFVMKITDGAGHRGEQTTLI